LGRLRLSSVGSRKAAVFMMMVKNIFPETVYLENSDAAI
jgi:hypothetical protein